MTDALRAKEAALDAYLRSLGGVAVAFSAGVDSTFLLEAARRALGDNAVAVTARSCLVPDRETAEAQAFCRDRGMEQIVLDFDALAVPGVQDNPPDRCYHCKKALFTAIRAAAEARGLAHVAEGSNLDDLDDYRPGMRAVAELGVLSPLRRAGLTKADVRALSKEMGLPTWDKPSYACLASRFVYGQAITPEKLLMADRAEQYLQSLGFRQARVRVHLDLARIEVPPEDLSRLLAHAGQVEAYCRDLGFAWAAMDLGGYRTGSMNRTLDAEK